LTFHESKRPVLIPLKPIFKLIYHLLINDDLVINYDLNIVHILSKILNAVRIESFLIVSLRSSIIKLKFGKY